MTDRRLRIVVGALALAGMAVAGYLTWARWADAELLCSTGGCETVQTSEYAKLLGIPVAALGLAAYAVIGATALSGAPLARAAGASIALAAVAFGAYLLVIQLAVIGETCDWCLASDGIATLLGAATLLRLRGLTPPADRPTTRSGRAPRDSRDAASA